MAKVPRKRKVRIKGIIRLLVLVSVAIFILYKIIEWNFNKEELTYYLEVDEIKIHEDYTALIIRKEHVLTSSSSGHVIQVADEGEKVKRGQRIMEISKDETLDSTIAETTTETAKVVENVTYTVEELDTEIETLKSDIAVLIENKDYKDVNILSTELSLKLEQRKRISEEVVQVSSYTETAVGEGELAIGETVVVEAKESGKLTYYIDGFEDDFTYEKVLSLNFSQIEVMDIVPELKANNTVNSGDVICKIVDDSSYYLIILVEPSDQNKFDTNKDLKISAGNRNITGRIEEMMPSGDKIAIAIKVDEYIEGFYKDRKVDISISQATQKGLVIRRTSLVKKDAGFGVYVVDKLNKVTYMPVKIISYNDDLIVIKQDSFYEMIDGENIRIETVGRSDEVVINAEDYEPGDVVD